MLQITKRYIYSTFGLLLFCLTALAQEPPKEKKLEQPKVKDSISIKKDSLGLVPAVVTDTIKIDTTKQKQPILLDKIRYKAKEYTKISRKENKIYLYDEAELYYQDTELKAGIIILDYGKNEVYAGRIKDSTGTLTQYPYFKQGQNVVEPDSIRFNFDTEKALIWNSRTAQNDFNVFGEMTKKENDSVVFIKNAKFTTSEDLDNPEYYFFSRRIKMVPRKKIITGFTNMYIADVPTPIGLPFAYFPLSNEKSISGILFPTFGERGDQGYFLQGLGYYQVINEYADIALLGDYFTNGSYGLRLDSKYALRYKFRGGINLQYQNQVRSQRGFPDFSRSTLYRISWNHSKDPKASPNSTFSANVNISSSNFFTESQSINTVADRATNQTQSSVSYSKTFPAYPSVNLSLTATHSQNNRTQTIDMTLPTFQANMERIYPFVSRSGSKKGIIKNLNFQYTVNGSNTIRTADSLFFKKEMFDNARLGVQHRIPVSTNFKLFKHLSVTMGTNYEESWVFETLRFSDYDNNGTPDDLTDDIEAVADTISGFESHRRYNFSAGIGTTIYGTFNFGDDKKIQAIRHTIAPRISYSLNPGFSQFFDEYVVDAEGNLREYSPFDISLFRAPGKNKSSSIGFTVSNNFEAKVRDKDTTATEPKKIKLLNNLNFSTNYNIAADSLRWSPVNFTGTIPLFNQKLNLSFGGVLDPYAIDNNGRRIEKFNIDNGGSLFRLTAARASYSYSFSNEDFKKGSKKQPAGREGETTYDLGAEESASFFGKDTDFRDRFEGQEKNKKEDGSESYYRSVVPWRLSIRHSFNYSNRNRERNISAHSLQFSGTVDLTPQWNIGFNSGYDFVRNGITSTQLRFGRDLKSWRMDFTWSPFDTRVNWSFFIGIKSSFLQDIKYDKQAQPDRRL